MTVSILFPYVDSFFLGFSLTSCLFSAGSRTTDFLLLFYYVLDFYETSFVSSREIISLFLLLLEEFLFVFLRGALL